MSKEDRLEAQNNIKIDAAFDELIIDMQTESRKAVNRAAKLYASRLKANAPKNQDPRQKNGKWDDPRHSADFIKVTNAKYVGTRPQATVGFLATKGLGWYMHFPDGGTVVRGSIHQKAQNFVERTQHETEGPIRALFYNVLRQVAK